MKPTICIFIFCLVIAFLLCTSSSPTVVQARHQPNASKGIPREPGIPDSRQSTTENDRLAFESIIAVHNTYFIVFIAAISVYFGIVGACWGFAFGNNHRPSGPPLRQGLFLVISTIAGVAIFIGMLYALGICAKHQCYLDNLAVKLGICSIDLSLLPYSAKASMLFIGVLSVINLILLLCVLLTCVRKCVKVILAPWVRHLMGK